jgi:YVTN family beta-propeller protein
VLIYRKMRALIAGLALFVGAPIIAGAAPFAYVPNTAGNTVSVVDISSGIVVSTIASVSSPRDVAVSDRSNRVYVRGNSTLQAIDGLRRVPIDATFPVFLGAHGLALSPSSDRLYVASANPSVADPSLLCVLRTSDNIGLGCAATPATEPFGVAVSPDGARVYVTQQNVSLAIGGTVSIFTTDPLEYVSSIGVGSTPTDIVVNSQGTRAYVANEASSNVSVINLVTNELVATIALGGFAPTALTLSPDGATLYVAHAQGNRVSRVNTATNLVAEVIQGIPNPRGVATNASGTQLYLLNGAGNALTVFDLTSGAIVSSIGVGAAPGAIGKFIGGGYALDIDGDGRVLATTDMLILMRWQLGVRGGGLIANIAIATTAARTTAPQIEQYLAALDRLSSVR